MSDSSTQLAYQSIHCFTDNGQLDLAELNYLLGIATADHVVDDDESATLRSIFKHAREAGVSDKVEERIQQVEKKHSL